MHDSNKSKPKLNSQGERMGKNISLRENVWMRLHELKRKLGKRTLSDVVEELLKVYDLYGTKTH